jgi:hypothetical protein
LTLVQDIPVSALLVLSGLIAGRGRQRGSRRQQYGRHHRGDEQQHSAFHGFSILSGRKTLRDVTVAGYDDDAA